MNHNPDFMFDLVPVIYRLRDAEQGSPLQALLRVVAEQAGVLEQDIAHLYENWFIETCDDWVVPYIGALVGYTPASIGPNPGTGARALARERLTISRREVANTIRYRRRKGTLSVLVDLAQAVAGWPALAVEFYRLLGVTQNIDYLRMDRGRTAELRDGRALDHLGTAFDKMAHTVDVRRVNSIHCQGKFNIPEVGLYVWRLRSYTVTHAPAYCYEEESPNCFLFSALGNDTPLFVNPLASQADPKLPLPITRRAMLAHAAGETTGAAPNVAALYGPAQSIQIFTGTQMTLVDPSRIVPADLSGWTYRPTGTQVALDPVLGRIMFPPNQARRQAVYVSYSYGFAADLGGGEYVRPLSQPAGAKLYQVGKAGNTMFPRIGDALAKWAQDKPEAAIIEITDSNVYAEPITVDLAKGQTLELRAAGATRPIIRLLEWQTALPDSLSIAGARGSWFVLDGIVVTGRGVQVSGDISGVTIRHCTLVPGWGLDCGCGPQRPTEPSLEVIGAPLCITIEHSIVGAIQIERDEASEDPLCLRINDSVIDATAPGGTAIGASGKLCAYAVLEAHRCTIFGSVEVHAVCLAEDSIFLGLILACRRQAGCMRFCYVPPASRTPRRYECQPDLVLAAIAVEVRRGALTEAQAAPLRTRETLRVEPEFDSVRYGTPNFARLARVTALEITRGASDRSEMGVYHDLYQPQRAANLAQRLSEFTPAGADAGIIYAS
jgi:hypothetical protein